MSRAFVTRWWTVMVTLDDGIWPKMVPVAYESDARLAADALRAHAVIARPDHRAWVTLCTFTYHDKDGQMWTSPFETLALWFWNGETWVQLVAASPTEPPTKDVPRPTVLRQDALLV